MILPECPSLKPEERTQDSRRLPRVRGDRRHSTGGFFLVLVAFANWPMMNHQVTVDEGPADMSTLGHYALLQITRTLIEHELGSSIGENLPRPFAMCVAPVTSFSEIAFVFTDGFGRRRETDLVAVELRNNWLNDLEALESGLVEALQTIENDRDATLNLNGTVTNAMASIAEEIRFKPDLPARNLMQQVWPDELQWNFWFARFLAINPCVVRSPSAASLFGELFVWCMTNTEEFLMNPQTELGKAFQTKTAAEVRRLCPLVAQWRRLAVAFALAQLDNDGHPPKDIASRWLANMKSRIQCSMTESEYRALVKFAREDLGLNSAEDTIIEEMLAHLLLETRIRALKLDRLIKLLQRLRIHKYDGKPVRNLPSNFSKRELVHNALIPRLKDFNNVSVPNE